MSRRSHFELGARQAAYAADLHLIQGELFNDALTPAQRDLWASIHAAAVDALDECRWAREVVA